MTRRHIALVLAAVAALVVVSLAAARTNTHASTHATSAVSGTVTFDGIWTADEAAAFGQVIKAFNKVYPNVHIDYKPVGNNLPTVLATAIAGGNPPDMADIAQPGYVKQLAQQGHLKPITYAKTVITRNFGPAWRALGSVNGTLYALVFKAANKSTLWYNVPVFRSAGVRAPATWGQLVARAKTIKASGTPPYSICGASGWTLTDLFENIYLRTYGPAKYNQLSAHRIKWTNPTVTKVLKAMAGIFESGNMAGGTAGALQTNFPQCATNAFTSPPKAAIVLEADFVGGTILSSTNAKPGTGFNAIPFPAITKAYTRSVEIGGDLLVTFRNTPAIQAFVKFLATPVAASVWARLGGFGTGNKKVPPSVYPDAITRSTEAPIGTAKSVVFDMSDEQPAAFGATTGQGEWGLFQKFLENPKNVSGIQKQLESAAAAAYKGGG